MGVIPDEYLIKEKFNMPGGGYIEVHDSRLLPVFLKMNDRFWNTAREFHKKLLDMGVKAYRCNDGWVDRGTLVIHFFSDDNEVGFYWNGLGNLDVGDLIFIGSQDTGGRFARIVDKERRFNHCDGSWSQAYHYVPLVETLDGEYGPYTTELNLNWRQKVLQKFGMLDESRIKTDICYFEPTEHI